MLRIIKQIKTHKLSETLFCIFRTFPKWYLCYPDFRLIKYCPNCGASGEDGGEILRWYFLISDLSDREFSLYEILFLYLWPTTMLLSHLY